MTLTNKQEEGLRTCIQRYRSHEPYTCIAGYAGSGKTTLVRFIIEALDLPPEKVAYIAFTGKAAQVLRSKGNPDAMTAHRLLYKHIQKKDGTFIRIPKDRLEIPQDGLICVDEVSMLPKDMWELLLSHHIHVIACGDPAQLPPIGETHNVLDHPHVFLDEIMRQAQESEIIRLTMDIRAGKRPAAGMGTEVNVVNQKDFIPGMYKWADQIICGTNKVRNLVNAQYRQMLWQDPEISTAPLIGDRIICLRNNWDITNHMGDALVNGSAGLLTSISTFYNPFLGTKAIINFLPDGYEDMTAGDFFGSFNDIKMDYKLITTGEPSINKENFRKIPRELHPNEFDYGYCITAHKSQGSEFPKVLVLEETFPFDKEEHARWLYTACTRASEKLTLVLKG